MHAVKRFLLVRDQHIGSAYVGCQHTFFNQAVRIVAGAGLNAVNMACVIGDEVSFSGFKFNGAALLARAQKRLKQSIKVVQLFQHAVSGVIAFFADFAFRQRRPDLVISQTRGAVHHGGVKLVGFHQTIGANDHIGHHAQAIHLGHQRT